MILPAVNPGDKPRILASKINAIIDYVTRTAAVVGGSAWGDITGTLSAQTDLQSALDAKEASGAAAAAVAAHVAAGDPHPTYTTAAEVTTAVGAAIVTHEGASDPHPGYVTTAEGAAAYDAIGAAAAAQAASQPLDADLTALAALTGTGGWAKRTGADTWSIATPTASDVGADASGTAAAAVSAHEADSTGVHGIADTSALLDTADIGVSVQAFDAQLSSLAGLAYGSNGLKVVRVNAGETAFELAAAAGGGDVTGPASSVDSEIALFSSTSGKLLKRASTTGLLKAASGVVSAAVAGTDYGRPYTLVATLAGNQATGANTTPVTLTGLVWTYEANSIYFFRWIGAVSPTANTTGCGFQLDVSSAVTEICMSFVHQLANTGTQSGGSSTADDASLGVSSGMPTNGTDCPVSGQGMLRTGANTGTAQLRFRAEVAAVTTAKAGMTLVVEKVG